MRLLQFAVLAATLAFAGPAAAQATLPDLGGRTVHAVTENGYVPLNFADPKTGKGIGWEYDAFNEIARRLNLTVEWKLSSWDVMIQAVREGQFDVGMDGIAITDERQSQVAFSVPYMVSEQFMLVRADETRFDDDDTFAAQENLLVGAQAGTTSYYTAVDELLDGNDASPRLKLFDSFGAAVQALKSGDVDLVLTDKTSAAGYMGASRDTFKLVGEPLGREEFGFIFKRGSDLIGPVNAAIEAMQSDGTIEALNRKWLYEYRAGQ